MLGRRSLGARQVAGHALLPLLALVAAVLVPLGLPRDAYLRAALWGGAILASCVGWGAGLTLVLFRTETSSRGSSGTGDPFASRRDWAMEAALGLALHVAFGGVLAMLSIVSVVTSVSSVGLGVLLFAATRWSMLLRADAVPAMAAPLGRGGLALTLGFYCIGVFRYLGEVATRTANPWDDLEAYFEFPTQLLASGSLLEPFSVRRLAAYGGQSYLHALFLPFGNVFRLHFLDNGICFLVVGGLVLGWVRERPRLRWLAAAPALLALVILPHVPHNVASELSGTVFFLALFRLFDRPQGTSVSPLANAVAVALCTFAACTLRQSNLVPAAVIVAVWYGQRLLRDPGQRARVVREGLLVGLLTIALLLPWFVVAYRSSGTMLYPIIAGNGRKDFGLFEPITKAQEAWFFVVSVVNTTALPGTIPALVAAGLLSTSRANDALRALLVGTCAGGIAVFHALAAADDTDSAVRYALPFTLACLLAVVLVASDSQARPEGKRRRVLALSCAGAAVLFQLGGIVMLGGAYFGEARAIAAELHGSVSASPVPADAPYRALQQAVPEHASLLVMLDEPFRLDFERNRIIELDQPGSASPPPHIPVGKGPERLAEYFLGVGIRYIAFRIDESSPEYRFSFWEQRIDRTPPRDTSSREIQLHAMALIYVDVFTNLEKLAGSRKRLFADGPTYVLDLATKQDDARP